MQVVDVSNVQITDEYSNQIVLLKKYSSREVVHITTQTPSQLKQLGYLVDNIKIDKGKTYVLDRVDCMLYHVKPMEKLSQIACKYGKTEQELMADNNLQTDKLYIGQILVIY